MRVKLIFNGLHQIRQGFSRPVCVIWLQPVMVGETGQNRFNGFPRAGRPLKRLAGRRAANTRLKPGVIADHNNIDPSDGRAALLRLSQKFFYVMGGAKAKVNPVGRTRLRTAAKANSFCHHRAS